MVDQVHRRVIAPVQVLDDQHQRLVLRAAVEQFAELAQHAVLARAGEFAPQAFALGLAAQPGQLQQPGRRDAAQQRGQRGVVAAERGQRLEHGQIRFAGAVLLDALALREGHRAERGGKVVDQRRLADAGFAGHQHSWLCPAQARSHAACRRDSAAPRPVIDGALGVRSAVGVRAASPDRHRSAEARPERARRRR